VKRARTDRKGDEKRRMGEECHTEMGSRGYPHTPAWHGEGHVPVLLRNANSFVIILIYAPVSRRATHRRRRSTSDGDSGGDGGDFVYTLLAFAPEISFPAFLQSADVYAMSAGWVGPCLEALSGQGESELCF